MKEHFFHPTSKSVQEGDSRFSPIQLTMAHFHEALKDYRPLRLSQGLQKEGGVAWSQVGGMFEVKQQLLEIFQWPLKYAHLLDSNASWVKLPTGVLLYGYPGCGKTWLGRAIAHEVGMSFMMVRGPELLDKYVGGSEARVREVFRKARLATPCLVFIDEVDALTPPRGQSSTMDRLVNQVLTELDGVEGRKGVYVMGATSRPDLMDPAMLRPGRLDTSIRCGFPTYQERMDLFTLLSHQPPMKVNIHDWHEWAQQTEGYTYADVQGFITQAYTEAVQWHLRSLESSTFDHSLQQGNNLSFPKKSDASWKSEPEGHDLSMYYPVSTTSTTPTPSSFTQPIEITELHLKKALEVMKPSLTEATRQQLTRIYDLFERGKVEMPVSGKLKFK
ncbi:Peroxisome biosynthesis protein pex1 [Coelomomyces lativittatus]|nr:Peroxisome biosynthesis protein pex1 [Coelomomyces lativittatus]